MNPTLRTTAIYIGKKIFAEHPIPTEEFINADWWENDGLLSTYSQMAPLTNGVHPIGREYTKRTGNNQFEPGKWHFEWARGMDHGAICVTPRWWQKKWQRAFYERLFLRLAALELS